MPLKIRCPHCLRILVADDSVAGEPRLCPACGRVFNVPLPLAADPRSVAPLASDLPKCPRCAAELAPTATICRRCATDVRTGRRLPLKRRLLLVSARGWLVFGVSIIGGVFVIAAGTQFIRGLVAKRTAPSPVATSRAVPVEGLATALLAAGDPDERAAALRSLQGVRTKLAPAVAAALASSLERGETTLVARQNQVAAIDLLAAEAQAGDTSLDTWRTLLDQCQRVPELHDAALRARALLRDTRVAAEIVDAWLAGLARVALFDRLARVAGTEAEPGVILARRRAGDALRRLGDGLRVLGQPESSEVYDRLVAAYWESWNWIGQDRGERLADEVFALAQPPRTTLEFQPEDVRVPRDVMKRVAGRAAPAVRAAAGLIVEQRGPQYRSLADRIAETLASQLPECDAHDQQRLAWTISRLRGRLFGPRAHADPRDMGEEEVVAALQWAQPSAAPRPKRPYPQPPRLSYRAVSNMRLLEQQLLAELRAGWERADAGLDRWLSSGLGCTPRLWELLRPGQRQPDYPALAAAMVIAGVSGDGTARPQLELWNEAREQPPWVRALAYTVLGSLDARRGQWESGWPNGLDLGDPANLDKGQPGWAHFGRVIAAGGPSMLQRLSEDSRGAVPRETCTRLIEAAQKARRRDGERP